MALQALIDGKKNVRGLELCEAHQRVVYYNFVRADPNFLLPRAALTTSELMEQSPEFAKAFWETNRYAKKIMNRRLACFVTIVGVTILVCEAVTKIPRPDP